MAASWPTPGDNSGHSVVSPREAGSPEALAVCSPLAECGGVIPPCAPFRVEVLHAPGNSVFTVWRGREPIVTCALAWTPEGAAEAWPAVEGLYLQVSDQAPQLMAASKEAKQPAALPWLAVVILPAILALRQEDVAWLADFKNLDVGLAQLRESSFASLAPCLDGSGGQNAMVYDIRRVHAGRFIAFIQAVNPHA